MDARALAEALDFYERAGFDTLPLLPNTRAAFLQDWQYLAPREMWQHAPKNANLGIRCEGRLHVAILDADNKTRAWTSANVSNFMSGLGISACPLVQTPNDGRHFYIAAEGKRAGAWCNLSPKVGAGEFRYGRGAMVAAPPSAIGASQYRLLAGDFTRLPRVAMGDLAPILATEPTPTETPTARETWKLALHPSRKAWRLLNGQDLEKYKSRSEHEQALLVSLANSGYDFDAVLSLFLQHPCGGKFRELYAKKPRNAIRWLEHSFENARQWAATREGHAQKLARAAMTWANSQPWRGRTGAVDRAVFTAHATIAYRAGRIVYAASCRDLAELAGIGFMTATRATHRLRALGLVDLVQEATFHLAQTFRLGRTDTLSKYSIVRECISTPTSAHDAFRLRRSRTRKMLGLGKTGAAVWEKLAAHSPLTAQDISAQTGRSLRAVNRALERMFQLQMVGMDLAEAGETWYALENVNLDDAARALGTLGRAARQRADHERQRADYQQKYNGSKARAGQSGT